MSIKFDKFNLTIPVGDLDELHLEKMDDVTSKECNIKSYRHVQKVPYDFFINYTERSDFVYIEFSGKVLLEDYPELIHRETIIDCFENLNKIGICKFRTGEAIKDATVNQCDVTVDIPSEIQIADLYNNLSFTNNQNYSFEYLDKRKKNRFAIKSTHTTTRYKERLVVYDKEMEMKTAHGKSFLNEVSNPEEQLMYFKKNRIRVELNLDSCDTIRCFFNISKSGPIPLTLLLNSGADPIGKFLDKAIRKYDLPLKIITHFGKPKDIKNLLFISLFQFDMAEVERYIRSISSNKSSIKDIMKPYNKVYDMIKDTLNEPAKKFTLSKVSAETTNSLYTILEDINPPNPEFNLLNLYNNRKEPEGNNGLF